MHVKVSYVAKTMWKVSTRSCCTLSSGTRAGHFQQLMLHVRFPVNGTKLQQHKIHKIQQKYRGSWCSYKSPLAVHASGVDLLAGNAHGEKGKEPCHQRNRSSCGEAVPTPHSHVVGPGEHRGQAYHACNQSQWQESWSDFVPCTMSRNSYISTQATSPYKILWSSMSSRIGHFTVHRTSVDNQSADASHEGRRLLPTLLSVGPLTPIFSEMSGTSSRTGRYGLHSHEQLRTMSLLYVRYCFSRSHRRYWQE